VSAPLVYVDTSAFLKLFLPEPEGPALLVELETRRWTSSVLLEVEATIAGRRRKPGGPDAVRALLPLVELVELDEDVRGLAKDLDHPGLLSLDAIHLATAISLGDHCDAFYTYDARLVEAARTHGLTVESPA